MSTQKNEHNPDGGGSPLFYPKAVGEPTRNEPELKPCPFCGGGASYHSRFDVKCSICGAEINSLNPTETWNRRITPPTDTTGSGREGETPEELKPDVLTYLKSQCNRYVNGLCSTLSCMKRGGFVAGVTKDPDYSRATCEYHEAIRSLTPEIESKGEAQSVHESDGCPTEGAVLKREWRRLTAQVEALRRDGERMDWLETLLKKSKRYWPLVHISTLPSQMMIGACNTHHGSEAGLVTEPTLRAAIDSAQRQEAK